MWLSETRACPLTHAAPLPTQFTRSTAEMICAGVLPIMQMRNVMPPMALIARRIPRHILEITYTIKLPVLPGDVKDTAGNAMLSPQQLLESYCQARGLFRARALGESDMPRAARQILKDFTDGRLLFCHPPAGQTPEVSFHVAAALSCGWVCLHFRCKWREAGALGHIYSVWTLQGLRPRLFCFPSVSSISRGSCA